MESNSLPEVGAGREYSSMMDEMQEDRRDIQWPASGYIFFFLNYFI